MGTAISMNNYRFFRYNIEEEPLCTEDNSVKSAQEKLHKIKNGEYTESDIRKLPEIIMKDIIKSVAEGQFVLPAVCDTVEQWHLGSSIVCVKGDSMDKYKYAKNFVESLKKQDDFQKAYIFEIEDDVSLWIIVESAEYNTNKKYLQFMREHKNVSRDYEEFEFLIFDKDEEDEIKEQISYLCKQGKVLVINAEH